MPMTHCEAVGIMAIWNEELCAECMWQHKGTGGFITFLRPFSFRKQTLSKQKLPSAKELETE